ncbi:MAG: SGNH/GDSL hydrolase family protein [Clostridia bacterium]|nr:SGNH/GDSL hydrolase family protein [Clostridia bacterium]
MKVQIYGDSIMKAVLVDENFKYHQISSSLLDQLQQDTGVIATNRAHFGYTAVRGQTVLQKDLDRGLCCDLALLEFGGNDCDHNWMEVARTPDAEHTPNTPLPKFLDTLKDMALSVAAKGIQPVLMTLPPLDAEKYLSFIGRRGADTDAVLSWLGDVQMIYRWQELYSNAIAQLAARLNLPLLDVRSRFLSRRDYSSMIARDGIHLTRPGYELIYDAFREQMAAFA